MRSEFRQNTTIVLAPEVSRIPQVLAIIENCYQKQIPYPARVEIVHDPGCNILQPGNQLPAEAHDCEPVRIKIYPAKNPHRWR